MDSAVADLELLPAGYLLEAKVAVKLLNWKAYRKPERSPRGGSGHWHTLIQSPDGEWSIQFCPLDSEWIRARGWPRFSIDPAASGQVAAVLIERGVISATTSLTPIQICHRALQYIKEQE